MLNKTLKLFPTLLLLSFTALLTLPVSAQTCPTIVEQAISAMDNACSATERNRACYGNGQIELVPQPDVAPPIFQLPGDQVEVATIQSLVLYPLDEFAQTWGITLMRVQANLPDTVPGQNVTILVFGDTELTSASQTMDAFYFRGGVGEADCAQAPNGILIQTPEGAGMIDLTVNDVNISLGSTAFLTADAGDFLSVYLLEGEAEVTAEGVTRFIVSAEVVTVPLDENLRATDEPTEPEDIVFSALPILPIELLPYDISEDVPDLPRADADTPDAPDGVIIPRSGNWRSTMGEVEASSGCPAGMASMMSAAIPTTDSSFVDFGGRPVSLEELLEDTEGTPFTYSNPEPNVYMAGYSEQDAGFTYRLEVLSETQLVGFFTIDVSMPGMTCVITVNFTVELID